MAKKPSPPSPILSESPWNLVLGGWLAAMAFVLPFLPDEKVVRLKMEGWEVSLLVLLLMAGIKALWKAPYPEWTRHGVPPSTPHKEAASVWPVVAAVLVWFLINTIESRWAPDPSLAMAEMRRVVAATAAFAAAFLVRATPLMRIWFVRSWSAAAALLSLYGLLQRTGGIGRLEVPQMDRIMGSFGNPIFFAAFLVPSLFLTVAALRSTRSDQWRWLWLGSAAVQAMALYFTETRAAWIAFGVVAGGWFVIERRQRLRPWVYGTVIAAAIAFALETRPVWNRDQGHLLIWRDTLRMWASHPFFGTGLGAFHVNFPSYAQSDLTSKWPQGHFIVNDAHNEYLQVLSEGGVILLGAFIAMLVLFFRWFRHRPHIIEGDDRPWFAAAVAALLVQNLFSADMRFGVSFITAFLLMGLSLGEAHGAWLDTTPQGRRAALRGAASAAWIGLGLSVWPALLEPYRAHKELSAMPGFFDQRLLDPAHSIQDLEDLAKRYPGEIAVLEKLAYVYAKEMKTPDGRINVPMADKAVSTYERILQLDPKDAAACNNLANIQYTLGHADEAMALWRKAVSIKPDFLDPHLNLGKILFTRGELKESARHFEAVLKIDPNNPEAIVYLKRMVE